MINDVRGRKLCLLDITLPTNNFLQANCSSMCRWPRERASPLPCVPTTSILGAKRQGHSGFAWTWLGAALQATSLPFGIVSSSGQRYHPAILAQAAATLATPALTAARRFSHSEPGMLRGATVGSMRPRPEQASDGREHTPNELLE